MRWTYCLLFGVAIAGHADPGVQLKRVAVDPEIHRLSTDALIDRLQDESQQLVDASANGMKAWHTEKPALNSSFAPLDPPDPFAEDQPPNRVSPVMMELVSRGCAALPALLDHLSDWRPTHISVEGPDEGIVELGDEYDPRYSDPSRWPTSVNTIQPLDSSHGRYLTPPFSYVFRVGDLCYLAVGQIVNRQLGPFARRPNARFLGNATVLSSTWVQPKLAIATRSDWQGLNPSEHEASLRADALTAGAKGGLGVHSSGALYRLLYYYPNTGREVAEVLLKRRLGADVTAYDQRRLMIQLRLADWPGLDALIYKVFQEAVLIPDDPVPAISGARDYLALECARRLVNRGYNAEFRRFFTKEIEANKAEAPR